MTATAPERGQPVHWPRVFQVAGAYIAFLIGSGFATGQEAMQYFVAFGWYGLLGTLVCLALLAYTCTSLMQAGRRFNLSTNESVFRHYCGPILGVGMTWYTIILIIAVQSVMTAGAAATLQQAYGIPTIIGAGSMALLCLATLLLGLNRILGILGFIGPVIIALTVITALLSFSPTEVSAGIQASTELPLLKASGNWLFSALLYVGLILPGLAGFLPAVGARLNSSSEVYKSSILGPGLFMVAMVLVAVAIFGNLQLATGSEIPIMALANSVLPVYGSIFAIVIYLGIFSTVTPLVWTVCVRFAEEHSSRYKIIALALSIVGLIGGTILPFGQLLNLIYPTVGYAGLLFLICVIVKDCRRLT
ncbi:MAG: hypothetical protein P8P91_02815 [Pseudomonadales bacterium]|nr:hypothetical protein [Pseudomonadales bacterium]